MPSRASHTSSKTSHGHAHPPAAAKSPSERNEADSEEVDPDELRGLLAIARLDMEAALAYEIAADLVEEEELSKMLTAFRDDHRRHVDELVRFAKSKGLDVRVTAPDPSESAFAALTSAVGGLDPSAALETLLANEGFTNATYETALWVVSDDAALEIVRRNREDERRHLEALAQYATEHEDDEDLEEDVTDEDEDEAAAEEEEEEE